MNLRYGDMWSAWDEADLFLVTTSATCSMVGTALVMGRGAAKEARDRFAHYRIDYALGAAVQAKVGGAIIDHDTRYKVYDRYHLIVSDKWPEAKLGIFQTKEWFSRPSDEMLISLSCNALSDWVSRGRELLGRDPVVHLNCPGIGHGRLNFEQVEPYIKELPSCVNIWLHPHEQPEDDLPISEKHPLGGIAALDRHNFLDGVANLLGPEAIDSFNELYTSPAYERNMRIAQWLTLGAYLALQEENNKEEAYRMCWEVGRNSMAMLRSQLQELS